MQLTKLAARLGLAAVLLATFNLQFSTARAQGTAFTYQGVLSQNGVAINGSNDLTFTLYNAVSAGATVGASNVVNDLVMSNGLFTVTLDFGAGAFDGSARWLQIAARPGLSLGAYTNLAPRTPITPTPYAMYAGGAALSGTYGSAVTFNNAANQFSGIGSNLTALNASQLTGGTVPAAALGNAWRITGNSNTTAGTHFLGTTDNRPLEFRVNNQRGLRLENGSNFFATGVNVIGGHSGNVVADGLVGATIAGGGANQLGSQLTNTVAASYATIGGGTLNGASGLFSTVAGGNRNAAAGESSSIGGGEGNQVTGLYGTIPGGKDNVAVLYALAAGYRAKANHAGSFVWADSTVADFASTANNQFLIRATGGVGIGIPNPAEKLHVSGNIRASGNIVASGSILTGDLLAGGNIRAGSLTATNPGYALGHTDGTRQIGTYLDSEGCWFGSISSDPLHFYVANGVSPSMTVATSGKVGIGTVGPATTLDVRGVSPAITVGTTLNTEGALYFGNSAHGVKRAYSGINDVGLYTTSADIYLSANGTSTNHFVLKNNGNVGIGTSTPTTKLHVIGDVTCVAINITNDRNAKEQFKPVNAREVLDKVARLPISEWQYKTQSDARHIGPMAQDFRAAFALGRDEKYITSVDADGVALAAIQGLNEKLEEKTQEVDALKKSVAELAELVKKLAAQQNGGAR